MEFCNKTEFIDVKTTSMIFLLHKNNCITIQYIKIKHTNTHKQKKREKLLKEIKMKKSKN